MEEIWKDIKGYEGIYQISNLGNARSSKYGKWNLLKPYFGKQPYKTIDLRINNKRRSRPIHILVAEVFIPNPDNLPEVNHSDGNKINCCVSNLYWCTKSHNIKHAWDTGLKSKRYGEDNHLSLLTQDQADKIRSEHSFRKVTYQMLAEKYNVSVITISRIMRNKIYTKNSLTTNIQPIIAPII
jgi:hypothetical protein